MQQCCFGFKLKEIKKNEWKRSVAKKNDKLPPSKYVSCLCFSNTNCTSRNTTKMMGSLRSGCHIQFAFRSIVFSKHINKSLLNITWSLGTSFATYIKKSSSCIYINCVVHRTEKMSNVLIPKSWKLSKKCRNVYTRNHVPDDVIRH